MLNISLPESMGNFVEKQMQQGGYSTASEYICALIRNDQNQAEQQKLEEMLLEGLERGIGRKAT